MCKSKIVTVIVRVMACMLLVFKYSIVYSNITQDNIRLSDILSLHGIKHNYKRGLTFYLRFTHVFGKSCKGGSSRI